MEELRGISFTWTKIKQFFSISLWTISHRVQENHLHGMYKSELTDNRRNYFWL